MAKSSLSQMTLLQGYFLVLHVPASAVKASQRSRLACGLRTWPQQPCQTEGPEPGYPPTPFRVTAKVRTGTLKRISAPGSLFHKSGVLVNWDSKGIADS